MSTENEKNSEKMGLFTPGRNTEVDRMIAETERSIANTQKFLEHLREANAQTRAFVAEQQAAMEEKLDYLKGINVKLADLPQPEE